MLSISIFTVPPSSDYYLVIALWANDLFLYGLASQSGLSKLNRSATERTHDIAALLAPALIEAVGATPAIA